MQGSTDFPALAISFLALALSMVNFYVTYKNRRRDIPFDVVPKSYERYYDMNKIELQYPHLTHLFVTYDKYEAVKDMVCKSVSGLDEAKKISFLLQERAVADLIMSYYEQILLQWESTKDNERKIVRDIINYFEGRLLRNPRLLWWWEADRGGLETSYEDSTRDEWKEKVRDPIDKSNADWIDEQGPFIVKWP